MVIKSKIFASAALILIVICGLASGFYLYQRNRQTVETAPTPTPGIPTPVPTAVLPPAIVISPIPTPNNLNEWIDSTPYPQYEWTFKYPPTWTETPILGGFFYKQTDPSVDFSINFFHVYERDRPIEEVTNVGKGNTRAIKHEKLEINGREVEIVYGTEIQDGPISELRIDVYIKGVDFNDFVSRSYHAIGENLEMNPDGCYENGMLNVSAHYDNPPAFTGDNIPYINDIKQMLTTFEFNECVPSK
ncbi:hypothetical protein HGA91_05290 [candidate division WWE3 bacterium]|nr:hypothetical protein [candidate division WWE3 bacterium]